MRSGRRRGRRRLRIERYELVPDSGGVKPAVARRARGDAMSFATSVSGPPFSFAPTGAITSPFGVHGGAAGSRIDEPAARMTGEKSSGRPQFVRPFAARIRRSATSPRGAGGYGDPLLRDPVRVLDDVRNAARSACRRPNAIYGVRVSGPPWCVERAGHPRAAGIFMRASSPSDTAPGPRR